MKKVDIELTHLKTDKINNKDLQNISATLNFIMQSILALME